MLLEHLAEVVAGVLSTAIRVVDQHTLRLSCINGHLQRIDGQIPAQSGKGIGKKLIEYVEQAARQEGLKAIELYTNETMSENLAMYPELGYLETETKRQAGFNRVFFRKTV